MLKNENGVTLIILTVTIVILTILASIIVVTTTNTTESSKDAKLKSELNMVQQAVLARYTKYCLTKDTGLLVGREIDDKLPSNNEGYVITDRTNSVNEKKYYLVYNDPNNNVDSLKKLGIENTTNKYIVNYYTGEVLQVEESGGSYIIKTTSSNEKLYIKGRNAS